MASYEILTPAKNGKPRIRVTVELGYDKYGQRIRKRKTMTLNSLTERAIKKAITEAEISIATSVEEEKVESMTVEMFFEQFMEMYVKPQLSISSRDSYASYFNNGILNALGTMQIREVTTMDLVEFFKEQKAAGMKSLEGKYMALKTLFRTALKWRVIKENPMNGVDRPVGGKRYKELEFYDEVQLKQLLNILDTVYPRHAICIKLAALVGLRQAEIAGIRMENIDYTNNSILIDKTLLYDKETQRFLLGPTKTKRPRIVFVPESFMDELKAYEIKQKKLRLALGDRWNPMLNENGEPVNLLITKPDGFPPFPNGMSNRFKEILQRHNLPMLNFHGLRHTYASYAISQGINFKIIQEQLGHANIQETLNTYSHLTMKDKKSASDLFDQLL